MPIFLIILYSISSFAATEGKENRQLFRLWDRIHKTAPGEARSIGSYSAGCLVGAMKLPKEGDGYAIMRPSRLRYYGNPALVHFLQNLGKKLKEEKLPLMLVGDMGRPRGGPMISGHASHQIGLDVDIWYRMSKKRPTNKQKESWAATDYVRKNKLSKQWGAQQATLVKEAAALDEVNRIFVHPVIKQYFCEKFPEAPWLYKLRAWWGHSDHLHVRLSCQEGDSSCEKQDALNPNENQCGEKLAWWFSPEATEELNKRSSAFAQRQFPDLPEECKHLTM